MQAMDAHLHMLTEQHKKRKADTLLDQSRSFKGFSPEELNAPFKPSRQERLREWLGNVDEVDELDLIYIEQTADTKFTEAQKAIFHQYRHIITSKVDPRGADLPPFKPTIDDAKWSDFRTRRNQFRPRMLSPAKEEILKEHIEKMLAQKIIRRSTEPKYSGAVLVPKPNDKWRFCVDFRFLNECTASDGMGWPIPNIDEMLQRLGQSGSKYFGVIDLTAGYHQAPMDTSIIKYTAFALYSGIYEWLRVPMGMKGAPSYFQYMMAVQVLGSALIGRICEVYLDDIIVHGATKEAYLQNLRDVLEALAKRRIHVNPSKIRSGMLEVEYVGHVIDATGIKFTREKLDSVLETEKPIYAEQMKCFIGIANTFRNHVRDMSMLVAPLQSMIEKYSLRKRRNMLVWTPEAEEAFIKVKAAVHECPKLFFPKYDDFKRYPVIVETDACDYGIGGAIFQMVDGEKLPIAIFSKSLSKSECKWSTIQKEAYAIYYCLDKYEYLLRDIFFTLRTDHKNLTYMNKRKDDMVTRWKLYCQHFNFAVEHIRGVDNEVADDLAVTYVCNQR